MSLRLPALLLIAAIAVVGLVYGANNGGQRTPSQASVAAVPPPRQGHSRPAPRPVVPATLVAQPAGRLPAAVQAPATAPLADGSVLLMGGLDSGLVSSSAIDRGRRVIGRLPVPVHDAAGAPAPGGAYLFCGGEPSQDAIVQVTASGHATRVGRLPAPASDVAAATLGGNYYVVGGYTGVQALSSIVEWKPGSSKGRVVARLPVALRYAAVASVGSEIVIAGGTDGLRASRAVYAFDPARRTVRTVARLPRPLTHSSAAALGGIVYLIGGRDASLTSQTRRILAIDPRRGTVRTAGTLPRGLSDVGVAPAAGGAIQAAGGRDSSGQVRSEVYRLAPH